MNTHTKSRDEALIPLVVTTLGLVIAHAGIGLDSTLMISVGAFVAVRAAERVLMIDTPPRWRWAMRWLLRLNRRQIAPRIAGL